MGKNEASNIINNNNQKKIEDEHQISFQPGSGNGEAEIQKRTIEKGYN